MYSVIIVDDENLVIKSLKGSIDWEEYGFYVMGFALNGDQCLELVKKSKPNVIFTDIRMPGMNGLELIKKVHGIYPDIQFVVVSGYAEFAYAQKAINNGAIGYCLKPFDDDEIVNVLKKAKSILDKQNVSEPIDILNILEQGSIDDSVITDLLKSSDLLKEKFTDKNELINYLRGIFSKPPQSNSQGIENEIRNQTFRNIIKYINENYCSHISIQDLSKRFISNPSYICQMFKKELGTTFSEYITNMRIDKAQELLRTTDLTVAEVAEKSGYNDYFHFSKTFKKITGLTPTQFRTDKQ